ncbi:hypothetical protein [Kribbella sp. CA-293567]|uniref:hypothetical protein n=1 Tax=Kribbella sp. CA-293567 TaxID=3002436 RepID=UPI0022DDCBCA|nr:hypothetical protein [Kribbella sp. CA-293567]WBQ03800.1 hypothetical protein OX958_28000 [Kribbella sp. CA-293567]
MTDPFSIIKTELPRDRWGRPLITPPDGGETVAYQRVTTFVGALEDTYHLSLWSQRMVALGMANRPDLQLAASAITDPTDQYAKRTLNDIAKSAREAAGAGAAATTGTALHTLSEKIDRGEDVGTVPAAYLPDLEAYRRVTKYFATLAIEGFCVRDDLRVGGSYDRIVQFTAEGLDQYEREHGERLCYPGPDADGNIRAGLGDEVQPGDTMIGDLKTGNVDFGIGKIAMQLGTYANSVDYDHTLGARTPLVGNPSKKWGVIVHLPAGTGAARLIFVDVAAGFDTAYVLAVGVHAWRKRKDLSFPFASVQVHADLGPSLVEQINAAPSYKALESIYQANAEKWTPGLTTLAKARTAELAAS